MTTNDGGPAFPIWQENMSLGDDAGPGMSLRDYFAAAALRGLMGVGDVGCDDGPNAMALIAEWSFGMADAMLKARDADDATD